MFELPRLYEVLAVMGGEPTREAWPYRCSIRRLPIFFIMPHFVKIILVQLANETREVAMLEVFRQYRLGKLFVL